MAERSTYIRLAWAGGVHRFHLRPTIPTAPIGGLGLTPDAIKQMANTADPEPELHDKERAIYGRLSSNTWGALDVYQPILVGLVKGGDFQPVKRKFGSVLGTWSEIEKLVRACVLDAPLAQSLSLAHVILGAAIYGYPAEIADKGLTADQLEVALSGQLTEA